MAYPNYGKPKQVKGASGAARPRVGQQNSSPRIKAQGSNAQVKVSGYTKSDGTRVATHFRRDSNIPNPNRRKSSALDKVMSKYYR